MAIAIPPPGQPFLDPRGGADQLWYRYFSQLTQIANTVATTDFLEPKRDFNAVGDGSTDDTAALQAWLTEVLTGSAPGYLSPGNYKISSPLTGTVTTDFNIFGCSTASTITLSDPTQNGVDLTINAGRFTMRDFTISANAAASAGACLSFDQGSGTSFGAIVDHITIFNAWDGISTNGITTSFITRNVIAAANNCLDLQNIGDTVVSHNYLNPSASGLGIILTGIVAGCRIEDNKINGSYQYGVSVIVGTSDGDLFLIGNSIEGYSGTGLILSRSGAVTFANVIVAGNEFSGTGHGISLARDTASHYLDQATIVGNVVAMQAAKTGIGIGNVPTMTVADNMIYGGSGTGIALDAGAGGLVHDNVISNQVTAITNSASAVIIHDNVGYNPVGASSVSPGASPYTYTAGASPETLYVSDSTSITNVTVGGTSILPHATAANQPLTLQLGPLEAAVITYSGTLSAKKMVH